MLRQAILVQTQLAIYSCNLTQDDEKCKIECLINDPFKVKLDMHRGLNHNFYFALRDESSVSDALMKVSFSIDNDILTAKAEMIPYPGTDEILALELDPLNSNDVDSYQIYEAESNPGEGKNDMLFLIDSHLNLFKMMIDERES